MDPEILSCIRWLMVCLILAMAARTYLKFLSLKFPDGGFILSLGIAMAVTFVSVWLLCTVFKADFDTPICVIVPLLYAVPGLLLNIKRGCFEKKRIKERAEERKRFILGFAVFVLLFLIAFWVKGFRPDIDHQTEQYMDYGFMTAMYRQKCMPFEDMWFAGRDVNYYYLGQAVAVFICYLAGVIPAYGYNLMLCMIFAYLALGTFSLTEAFLSNMGDIKKINCVTGGIMSSVMCSMGGNGHWIIYGMIGQLKEKMLYGKVMTRYWFPMSTLFIGYSPMTMDRAKHEFPSYTMVLGDLHAHVVNILFTISLLMLLFDYALKDREDDKYREIFNPDILLIALLLGLFKGTNFWDFPIYFIVAGSVILFCDIKKYGPTPGTIAAVILKGLIVYATGALIMLPFQKTYVMPLSGIHLCDSHSPVYKLLIIWFVHLLMALSLLIHIAYSGHGDPPVHMHAAAAVTMCGLGLLLLPEIIYVKDIYGEVYQRYNTMFKLTFQGFILLSVAGGICIGVFIGKKYLNVLACIFCVAAIALGSYMGWSVKEWFGNVFDASARKGINATAFIDTDKSYDDVREAIEIINSDPSRHLRIIEEAGNSYSSNNRLSVFTGASTIAGWYVHEWVWHNDSKAIHERNDEVRDFYESGNEERCRRMIEKYDIDYIFVGPDTTGKYVVDYDGFINLGEHVWESDDKSHMLIRIGDG